jgi:protein adenylyltransferase
MNIHTPTAPHFRFDNTYARELEGFYTDWQAAPVRAPKLLAFNNELAAELGLDAAQLNTDAGADIFAGNTKPDGANPLAQAYAGHQFGGFSPSLGDGRALLLGEIIDINGNRRDLQLKGSGQTPFSRGGDGRAAIGPVLREYLMGEAMHALGIPTTRALAAVATGEPVIRETALPGAILTRVAASHIRVGTFQYFAVRKDWDKIKQLADYVIARHYPLAAQEENRFLALFHSVMKAQAKLVASWMHIGFIHGVMNTDNMSISGETIDYGPCAFMDRYAPATVFSSIDAQGRYAYANQPAIAQWNLTRFAETLINAIGPDQETATALLTDAINAFPDLYIQHWLAGMRAKIGLTTQLKDDLKLVNGLFAALENQNVDYTAFFRELAKAIGGNSAPVKALFEDADNIAAWLSEWHERLGQEDGVSPEARAADMNRINPVYIPRNHKVEEALTAAVEFDDLGPFNKLLEVLKQPYDVMEDQQEFGQPAPLDGAPYQTFCGT